MLAWFKQGIFGLKKSGARDLKPGPHGPEPEAASRIDSTPMLTAFILVESTREGLTHLGSDLAAVEGVAEVYTVTGDWDFIAIVRVREHDDLAKVVTQHLTRLDGIERTQTMVAFQQFSAHDLEAMFGLGLEDKTAT